MNPSFTQQNYFEFKNRKKRNIERKCMFLGDSKIQKLYLDTFLLDQLLISIKHFKRYFKMKFGYCISHTLGN